MTPQLHVCDNETLHASLVNLRERVADLIVRATANRDRLVDVINDLGGMRGIKTLIDHVDNATCVTVELLTCLSKTEQFLDSVYAQDKDDFVKAVGRTKDFIGDMYRLIGIKSGGGKVE